MLWAHLLPLAGCLLTVAVVGYLGGAEAALNRLSLHRLRQLVAEGETGLSDLEDHRRVLNTLLIARTVLLLLLGNVATYWAAATYNRTAFIALSLGVLAVLTVLVEIVSRRWALADPETAVLRTAPVVRILTRALHPLIRLLITLCSPLTPPAGENTLTGPILTEEDIKALIDQGKEQGVLEHEESEMLGSVLEFGETIAREVMVPRVDIVAVPLETSMEGTVDAMIEHGFSRLPVYKGGIDHIVGIVYMKDLLVFLRQGRMEAPLQEAVRQAKFVPGTKKVDDILRELQRDKVTMAIVVDEYGGTEGLLTVEDLLEEIVGEITDEYDRDITPVERTENGAYILDAKMIVEDVNEELGLSIPADRYETLGGFLYGLMGRVPAQGESVYYDGARITVEELDRQRITRVRVERLSPGPGAADGPGSDP